MTGWEVRPEFPVKNHQLIIFLLYYLNGQSLYDLLQYLFLVGILQGQVVAYGGVWLVIDEAHVTTIAVAAEHRREGIGQRLMIELLKQAQTAGMVCSTLEVRASNDAAIKMYEKFGYNIAATRKGYYPDNKEDAVVMWLYDLDKWEPPRS